MERKYLGKQKIEMVKIQNPYHLQVSFSKRRAGLFKKASELSTFCGVDVALIVFSPGGKVFTFGHPSMEIVVQKFLGHDNHQPQVNASGDVGLPTEELIEFRQNDRVSELIMQLAHLKAKRESQKKMTEEIDRVVKENREAQGWVRGPYDDLSLQQLAKLKNGMEILLKDVHHKVQQLMTMEQGNGFSSGDGGGGGVSGGGGGGETSGSGGSGGASGGTANSAFPVNACMPSCFNNGSTSGASGSGFNLVDFPFSCFESGVMVSPPGGSTSNVLHGGGSGGGGGDASGGAAGSTFPIDDYMPSGFNNANSSGAFGSGANVELIDFPFSCFESDVMLSPPWGSTSNVLHGGGGADASGGAAGSTFPINGYMPSGFNNASSSSAFGSGANVELIEFPFSCFESDIMVSPPWGSTSNVLHGGGGGDASGGAAGSTFPINGYMPSGFNNVSSSSAFGSGANVELIDFPFSCFESDVMVSPPWGSTSNVLHGGGAGGGATGPDFPINAYMPSGFDNASSSGASGLIANLGIGFPFSRFASGLMTFPPGGSTSTTLHASGDGGGNASGTAAASGFPVNAFMPSGFINASTRGASGSDANLGNVGGFFWDSNYGN